MYIVIKSIEDISTDDIKMLELELEYPITRVLGSMRTGYVEITNKVRVVEDDIEYLFSKIHDTSDNKIAANVQLDVSAVRYILLDNGKVIKTPEMVFYYRNII